MGRRRDRGQAAVEFAVALPVVVVLVLGIVQVVIVAGRQAALEQLARVGARAASVAADPPSAAAAAVERSSSFRPVEVRTTMSGTDVTVVVEFVDPTDVPIIGAVLGERSLSATATMRRELPDG
jgi:Flp pilus assembly protein TadG